MGTVTEGRHAGEFILSEANFHRSRENVTIAVSQTIKPGAILAKKAVIADVVATPAAASGNTGNATIAMTSPELTTKVKDGRYKGISVTATTVRWEDPSGKDLGVSTHGQAFAKGGIKFTITAGGNANVAGDEFYVDVAADAADFQFVAFNQDGTDGSEIPAAVAIHGVTTPNDATAKLAVIARDAEVKAFALEWPSDIEAGEKANAVQALGDLGIIVRS